MLNDKEVDMTEEIKALAKYDKQVIFAIISIFRFCLHLKLPFTKFNFTKFFSDEKIAKISCLNFNYLNIAFEFDEI